MLRTNLSGCAFRFGDRAAGDLVPQVRQCTLDAPITPGPRLLEPSCFCEISRRCQASKVSGVTIVAKSARSFPPAPGPDSQATSLVVAESKALVAEFLATNAVLLTKVVDQMELALVHPAGDSHQEELEWIQKSRHLVDS